MGKWIMALAILAFSFAACTLHAQENSGRTIRSNAATAAGHANRNAGSAIQQAATTDRTYAIGPDDVLDISVWKEPEITQTVPVRPDGKISLPLLNDVQAAGLTPMRLAAVITSRLKKYLENPQVTVIVTQINSQRYYIMGEVTRAGAYPLLPDMTILQALSGAGGFTPYAKLSDIYLLRTVDGHQTKFPFNYKDVLKGNNTNQNKVLQAGDTIIVP